MFFFSIETLILSVIDTVFSIKALKVIRYLRLYLFSVGQNVVNQNRIAFLIGARLLK